MAVEREIKTSARIGLEIAAAAIQQRQAVAAMRTVSEGQYEFDPRPYQDCKYAIEVIAEKVANDIRKIDDKLRAHGVNPLATEETPTPDR